MPRNWKWISPGSLVGALAWLALSGPVRPLHELLRLLLEDVRSAGERHRPAALAELLRVRAALRRRAELRARPPGGDQGGRRRGCGARQAEPAELAGGSADADAALELRRARVGVEAERSLPEPHPPGDRARAGPRRLAVDPGAGEMDVVHLRAIADDDRVQARLQAVQVPPFAFRSVIVARGPTVATIFVTRGGNGGGGGGGGSPTTKRPCICPLCGSQTKV